ncbi:GAF domain-containing protein [Telluribacter humicola]|uniref:GAF domain-containing protein n=1 Tax=Telluribacter humicola TaxID=1720261 RepID=UPI001A9750EB|nr:GAF domain-containing protein [Telluribacter humicola]
MKPAPLPDNEQERLKALQQYDILDTLPEDVYDDITRIASEICGTPYSLLTLVDKDRQWFKAKQGMDVTETPRIHFCAYAIIDPNNTLVVPDARYDERFHDNPLVTGEPHLVFYAGVPLTDKDGYALGTLCVLDNRPRELSEQKLTALKALAKLISVHFELRKTKRELQNTLDRLQNLGSGLAIDEKDLQQLRTLIDPMLTEVEALVDANPRPDQLPRLEHLQKVAQSLKTAIEGTPPSPSE